MSDLTSEQQVEIKKTMQRLAPLFDEMRHFNSKQIGDILVNAHNEGLLSITGGLFEQDDIDKCYVALIVAIGMLKDNNLECPGKCCQGCKHIDLYPSLPPCSSCSRRCTDNYKKA